MGVSCRLEEEEEKKRDGDGEECVHGMEYMAGWVDGWMHVKGS